MTRRWAGVLFACAVGCGTSAATTETSTSDATETGSSSTATGSTTYDAPIACDGSEACEPGFCVAPYDAGLASMGTAICVDACVPELALERWCIDDAACCGGLDCNTSDGLCVREDQGSETSIGDSWATLGSSESTGDTSTSTSTGSDTDTSSSTG